MIRSEAIAIAKCFVEKHREKHSSVEVGEIDIVVVTVELSGGPKKISESEIETFKNEKVIWSVGFKLLGEEIGFPKLLVVDIDNTSGRATLFKML